MLWCSASFISDSTSSALSGNTEAKGCSACGSASSAACGTKRVPKISSMVLRAASGMSFIRGLSTIRTSRSTLHPFALPVARQNGIHRDFRRWGDSRSREVGRGSAESCVQVPGHKYDYGEHCTEDREFDWSAVADRLGREDQAGYDGHRERDAPVEAACLRVRP